MSELESYLQRAVLLHKKGSLKQASLYYKYALNIDPNNLDAIRNLATLSNALGNYKESYILFNKALEINPKDYSVLHNYANLMSNLGKYEKVVELENRAVRLNPVFAEAYATLGESFWQLDKLDDALISIQKSIKLKPNLSNAYLTLGCIFRDQGKFSLAIKSNLQAIKYNEKNIQAYSNLANLYFLVANYNLGWSVLEKWEVLSGSNKPLQLSIKERWDGGKLNNGESLLVVSANGLGDTLQFMRYLILLNGLGINYSFCCQEKLHDLIKISGINPHPLSLHEKNNFHDCKWITLRSLPGKLGVLNEKPLIATRYINAKLELYNKWKKIISANGRVVVGINWQGSKRNEIGSLKGRSIPLELFSPIVKLKGFVFISLQKGFGSEQFESCSFKQYFSSSQYLVDRAFSFAETAAIVENCDLVITTDTSMAHLAGGMGKRTWLLLQKISDWRWGVNEQTTFWYPTIKIFRQKYKGDWKEVIFRLSHELKIFFCSN